MRVLQASRACFEPKVPLQRSNAFTADAYCKQTRRRLPGEDRPAADWSEEEAYFRTGVYCSVGSDFPGILGGAHRKLPLYHADAARRRRTAADVQCTKHQLSHGALAPGLVVRAYTGCVGSPSCGLLLQRDLLLISMQ